MNDGGTSNPGSDSFTATSTGVVIVFFAPNVIYDTASLADATGDLKAGLKHMKKELKEQ